MSKHIKQMAEAENAAAELAEHQPVPTCKNAADWLNEPDEPNNPLVEKLIERGEVVALVGQSKAGKSFAALQLAVCIATGVQFLGHKTTRCRTYIANLEVSSRQYKLRLRRMLDALDIKPEDLSKWLFIDNMKGEAASWEGCREEAKKHGCEVVLLDPFYQVFKGDESDPTACADALEQMKAYQKDGITLAVVFHSPKGFAGDRQLIDMISGSSMLARFPESIVGILNHATQRECRVVKTILRNYPPTEDQTIRLEGGAFHVCDDISPDVETGASRFKAAAQKSNTEIAEVVLDVLKSNGMQKSKGTLVVMTQDECQRRWGATKRPGEKKVAAAIRSMVDHSSLIEGGRAHERGGSKPIGTPEQMEMFTQGGEE